MYCVSVCVNAPTAARKRCEHGRIKAQCVATAGYEGVFCRFFAHIYTTYCYARVMRVIVFAIKGGCQDPDPCVCVCVCVCMCMCVC